MKQRAQSLEVKAGTLITFDGSLVHFSHPNRSLKSREAYSLHIVDGTAEYVSTNWFDLLLEKKKKKSTQETDPFPSPRLQRGEDDPFRGF